MANTKIKILRGLKKDLPLLDRGEIAFCTDTKEFFAGDGEKNLLLSLSKEQFDELYKTTEAQEIVNKEVVVPGSATDNSGIPFTKEMLETITISVTQHDLFGELDILVDGVPQGDNITWEDREGYFYLNVYYPNEGISFNWVFVYEDGEYGWWGYTVQGDILDTAALGSATFLISANVPFSIDRQFVLLDEVYKKDEVDTKLDEVYKKDEVDIKFDEVYKKDEVDTKISEALSGTVNKEVVVPSGDIVNSGIPFTKEILENITISVTQHEAMGDLDILVDGVPQEDYITWDDRGGYFYLNVDYPNATNFNWAFVYEDGEYTIPVYTVQGDIYDTAMLGSTTFLISAIDRQFVLLDEVYKKDEVDTKISEAVEVNLADLPYLTQVANTLASVGRYDSLEEAWDNQENFTVNTDGTLTDYIEQDPHVLDIVIPKNVKSIEDKDYQNLLFKKEDYASLTLPNGITSIGDYAFSDWKANNQQLVIPDSVTSIGNNAFQGWEANNQQLVIPDSVTSIGAGAFQNWSLVPYVEIQAITPPTLSNPNAFNNQNDAPIYVPDESVDDYKTATNWSALSDRIFSINEK